MAHDVKRKYKKQIIAFGSNLQRVRVSKGISQEVLSEMANVAYSSINKIENGQLNTTIATVFALAKALEVPPSRLFDF